MSLSARIREQLISSFRVELAEHVQTMTNGLLALEQGRLTGEQRQPTLEEVFRAAHSLKGAARAVGVMAVEQLAQLLQRHRHTLMQRLEGNGLLGSQGAFEIVESRQQVADE